ncbi:hypothetical protein ACFJIX_03940 [Roseateles sp. UC29_93]|uniref:hypothetical protein n=1 Tax=Roseateles sp. UC29_93 TaxID=3350177 RepID=UPI0036727F67
MTIPIDNPPPVPRQTPRDHAFADVVVVHRHPLMRAGIAAALSPTLPACDVGGTTVPLRTGAVGPRLLVQAVIQAMRRDLIDEGRYSSAIDSDCLAQDRTVTSRGGVGNIPSHPQATPRRASPRRSLLNPTDGA